MSITPKTNLLDHLTPIEVIRINEDISTTESLLDLGIYYSISKNFEISIYTLTKTAKFKEKTIHTSKRDTKYFNHKASNYTLFTVEQHIMYGTELEKGIDRKFSTRRREKKEKRVEKVSLFTKIVWFIRGGK